jgi:tetratricopeptide (TPR) repeat protein
MKRGTWVGAVLAVVLLGGAVGGVVFARYWRHRTQLEGLPTVDLSGAPKSIADEIRHTRGLVDAEPRSASAWGSYGSALVANEFFAAAPPCFARAEKLDPADGRWPHLLGLSLVGSDRTQAAAAFRRAIAAAPKQTISYLALADLLAEDGADVEAEKLFLQALQLEPGNPRTQLALARIDFRAGRYDAALKKATAAAKFVGNRRDLHQLLLQIHQRMNQTADAQHEERILGLFAKSRQDPSWEDPIASATLEYKRGPASIADRAKYLIDADNPEEAVRRLTELSPEEAEDPIVLTTLGRAQTRLGEFEKAAKTFEAALAKCKDTQYSRTVTLAPQSAKIEFDRGMLAVAKKEHKAAAERFEAAAKIKPDYDVALYNLGQCYNVLGDKPAAIAAFERAVKANSANVDARLALAKLLINAGRKKDAQPLLVDAALLFPNEPAVEALVKESAKQ